MQKFLPLRYAPSYRNKWYRTRSLATEWKVEWLEFQLRCKIFLSIRKTSQFEKYTLNLHTYPTLFCLSTLKMNSFKLEHLERLIRLKFSLYFQKISLKMFLENGILIVLQWWFCVFKCCLNSNFQCLLFSMASESEIEN